MASRRDRSDPAYDQNVAAEEFQVWTLTVRPDKTATLACDDGNGNVVFSKEIPYTDFPLDTIKLYFATTSSTCPVSIDRLEKATLLRKRGL